MSKKIFITVILTIALISLLQTFSLPSPFQVVPALAGCIEIDCPPDTLLAAGYTVALCPLRFTNCSSESEIFTFYFSDDQSWCNHDFAAGFSYGNLAAGASHNICNEWGALSLTVPPGTADSTYTEARLIVRTIYDTGPRPLLTITGTERGEWSFQGFSEVPVKILVPTGQSLEFSWTGDASGHGAGIEGYRYGWDVLDIFDPNEWEVHWGNGYLSSSRTFYSGVHFLIVQVVDDSGSFSQGEINIEVVPGLLSIPEDPSPDRRIVNFPAAPPGPSDCAICAFSVTAASWTPAGKSSWGEIKNKYNE
ncbi:MAG: hypothetical protein JXB45_04865 [Candidatus Krumholzibacteriota bacterium]|nr:hypothetical protein [Candidatus Krumholzibacteriota bacterium]